MGWQEPETSLAKTMPDQIAPAGRSPQRPEFLVLFIAAAFFHFWGATVAWDSLNLPGPDRNFYLLYPARKQFQFSLPYAGTG